MCGLGIEPRKFYPECRRLASFGRQHRADRHRKIRPDSAGSETPCTHTSTSQAKAKPSVRKPGDPGFGLDGDRGPCRESARRTTAMNEPGKSDKPIVPAKSAKMDYWDFRQWYFALKRTASAGIDE